MRIRYCNNCDGSLTGDSKFCGNCGHQTDEGKALAKERSDAERADFVARGGAMAVIFVGSIAAMVGVSLMAGIPDAAHPWTVWLLDLGICAAAAWWVGGATLRHSLGRPADAPGLLLACLIASLTFAVAYGYASLLPRPEMDPNAPNLLETLVPSGSKLGLLLMIAVMPALVEEWMCRGVLWVALRPISTRWTTIVVTAALFAFLHGLNGGFLLELPHRFVMGLCLGWLRATTGSLWPCVLAHFLHNGTAVLLGDL